MVTIGRSTFQVIQTWDRKDDADKAAATMRRDINARRREQARRFDIGPVRLPDIRVVNTNQGWAVVQRERQRR